MVFGRSCKNGVLVTCHKQEGFDDNGKNDEVAFHPVAHKNKGFAPQIPESDESGAKGGCHLDKVGVTKTNIFATLIVQRTLLY